ncbi:hypothetical protein CCUS01_06599 [Colletotrichum cuscutae]|uniref:Uncharacterized protein n=1 Tax=Colletotrichum cuscutae TaxID=1209917 RepID=A0AAI9V9K5_9PEZI|nr:hypothetical protein CCUS01_06599 [Colletotrichum cuscutae]
MLRRNRAGKEGEMPFGDCLLCEIGLVIDGIFELQRDIFWHEIQWTTCNMGPGEIVVDGVPRLRRGANPVFGLGNYEEMDVGQHVQFTTFACLNPFVCLKIRFFLITFFQGPTIIEDYGFWVGLRRARTKRRRLTKGFEGIPTDAGGLSLGSCGEGYGRKDEDERRMTSHLGCKSLPFSFFLPSPLAISIRRLGAAGDLASSDMQYAECECARVCGDGDAVIREGGVWNFDSLHSGSPGTNLSTDTDAKELLILRRKKNYCVRDRFAILNMDLERCDADAGKGQHHIEKDMASFFQHPPPPISKRTLSIIRELCSPRLELIPQSVQEEEGDGCVWVSFRSGKFILRRRERDIGELERDAKMVPDEGSTVGVLLVVFSINFVRFDYATIAIAPASEAGKAGMENYSHIHCFVRLPSYSARGGAVDSSARAAAFLDLGYFGAGRAGFWLRRSSRRAWERGCRYFREVVRVHRYLGRRRTLEGWIDRWESLTIRFLRLAFWLMPGPFHDVWFGLATALAHGLERQGVCCSRFRMSLKHELTHQGSRRSRPLADAKHVKTDEGPPTITHIAMPTTTPASGNGNEDEMNHPFEARKPVVGIVQIQGSQDVRESISARHICLIHCTILGICEHENCLDLHLQLRPYGGCLNVESCCFCDGDGNCTCRQRSPPPPDYTGETYRLKPRNSASSNKRWLKLASFVSFAASGAPTLSITERTERPLAKSYTGREVKEGMKDSMDHALDRRRLFSSPFEAHLQIGWVGPSVCFAGPRGSNIDAFCPGLSMLLIRSTRWTYGFEIDITCNADLIKVMSGLIDVFLPCFYTPYPGPLLLLRKKAILLISPAATHADRWTIFPLKSPSRLRKAAAVKVQAVEAHKPTNTEPNPRKTQFFCHCFEFPLYCCCCCFAHIMLRLNDGKTNGPSSHNHSSSIISDRSRWRRTHVKLASVDSTHTCTDLPWRGERHRLKLLNQKKLQSVTGLGLPGWLACKIPDHLVLHPLLLRMSACVSSLCVCSREAVRVFFCPPRPCVIGENNAFFLLIICHTINRATTMRDGLTVCMESVTSRPTFEMEGREISSSLRVVPIQPRSIAVLNGPVSIDTQAIDLSYAAQDRHLRQPCKKTFQGSMRRFCGVKRTLNLDDVEGLNDAISRIPSYFGRGRARDRLSMMRVLWNNGSADGSWPGNIHLAFTGGAMIDTAAVWCIDVDRRCRNYGLIMIMRHQECVARTFQDFCHDILHSTWTKIYHVPLVSLAFNTRPTCCMKTQNPYHDDVS